MELGCLLNTDWSLCRALPMCGITSKAAPRAARCWRSTATGNTLVQKSCETCSNGTTGVLVSQEIQQLPHTLSDFPPRTWHNPTPCFTPRYLPSRVFVLSSSMVSGNDNQRAMLHTCSWFGSSLGLYYGIVRGQQSGLHGQARG